MDFKKFLQDFAKSINGQFSEYDNTKSVIIIPLKDERFQAVIGHQFTNTKYNREVIEFTSKVCEIREKVDFIHLLRETDHYIHVKFIVGDDNFLKVASTTYVEACTPDLLKEIIIEVAYVADEWENIITGVDVN